MGAAAGPALRAFLGPEWRGSRVRACRSGWAGDGIQICVEVVLDDWCECYRGTKTERVIDLGDDAFRQLAPLSRGLVGVEIFPVN